MLSIPYHNTSKKRNDRRKEKVKVPHLLSLPPTLTEKAVAMAFPELINSGIRGGGGNNNNIGTTMSTGDGTLRSNSGGSTKAPPPTMTEKAVAMAFPELINSGTHHASSSGSSSTTSNNDNTDNSSGNYSFESLFNGSTYYIDEYFHSIGYDGTSVNNNTTTDSISALSVGGGTYHNDDDGTNASNVNMNTNDSSNDVESVYTSSSSTSSSTLNGLIISTNDESSPTTTTTHGSSSNDASVPSASVAIHSNTTKNLETVKEIPTNGSTVSFRVKFLAVLEKLLVTVLLLAIITGCIITTVAIVRHFHFMKATNDLAVPGIMASSSSSSSTNETTIPTTTTITTNTTVTNITTDEERLQYIRMWIADDDFDPLPGTPQYDALVWLAYVDVPSILGTDLQPRNSIPIIATNDRNQTRDVARWSTNLSIRITQRFVLLVLFFTNIGTENLMLGGWASLTGARLTECIWPGITCRSLMTGNNSTNGTISVVTGVELNPNIANLHGTIPTEIGLLSYLETLVFMDNLLSGDIPTELYTLQNLYTLRISNTSVSTTLPSDIGRLTDMKFLDVSNNNFCSTIPSQFGELTNLQYLNLAQNSFTGTIPSEIGKLQLLQKFMMEENDFSGAMPSTICALPSKHRLEELHADCVSPFFEHTVCDGTKDRIRCNCCTFCY